MHGPRDLLGRGRAGDVREQDPELVAAEAGHGVGLAQHAVQARAHLPQEEIARVMAQGVVDLLEPVEVDQEEGGVVPVARARQDRLVRAVAEEAAVREGGQRVVAGVVRRALGVLLQLVRAPPELA